MLNALKSDDVATAQASLTIATLVADTHLINPMYPLFGIHKQCLNVERIIGKAICNTEGHPRRVDFVSVQNLSHLDPLPSTVGGLGAVWDNSTGKYLSARPPEVIRGIRDTAAVIPVQAATYPEEFYFGYDGSRFFSSLTRSVKVETYTFAAMPTSLAGVDALFSSTAPQNSFLPDEFQGALEYGTAGVCAAKVSTFPEEAGAYLDMFTQLLAAQGVSFKMPADFASAGSPTQ